MQGLFNMMRRERWISYPGQSIGLFNIRSVQHDEERTVDFLPWSIHRSIQHKVCLTWWGENGGFLTLVYPSVYSTWGLFNTMRRERWISYPGLSIGLFNIRSVQHDEERTVDFLPWSIHWSIQHEVCSTWWGENGGFLTLVYPSVYSTWGLFNMMRREWWISYPGLSIGLFNVRSVQHDEERTVDFLPWSIHCLFNVRSVQQDEERTVDFLPWSIHRSIQRMVCSTGWGENGGFLTLVYPSVYST